MIFPDASTNRLPSSISLISLTTLDFAFRLVIVMLPGPQQTATSATRDF
jgi:hypothetical protein